MSPNRQIKLRHVRTFLEVSRRKSVVKAADALAISQPAVSKALRELEDILGVRLLERSRRGVFLTGFGEIFQKYAGTAMVAFSEAIEAIQQARDEGSAPLKIGVLPTVAATIIPKAVRQFKDDGANAVVSLVTGPNVFLLERLRTGDLDLVVGRLGRAEEMHGHHFEPLYSESVAFVTRPGHPLTREDPADLARLPQFEVLYPVDDAAIRQSVEQLLIAYGVGELPNRIETVSADFARAYTRRSDAVWIISSGVVVDDVNEGVLDILAVDTSDTSGPVGLTSFADREPSPALRMFMNTVKSVADAR